jgi:thioredoxin-related protein
MMKLFKSIISLFTAFAFISPCFALEGWSADLAAALEKAKIEKKSVLIEFTGSDWCPPCMAMRKNVFSKKEFVEPAAKDFILVELDFPNGDEELKKKNEPMAEKYKIDGFPTIILLNSEGKEFSRFYASEHPTTEKFLAHLKTESAKK